MFKNQLQELAQRSCFHLPAYACVREGPDHAPRFKASVVFNGEIFGSPSYSTTLRQAEHAAAEAALNSLSARGSSKSLTARVLDETGVYKNLLQETAHRAGFKLPVYTTVRSGPGHIPVFTSTVEIAQMSFSGEAAKTKKQAEKNAAIAAWSALKPRPLLEHQENVAGAKCSRRRDDQPRGRMQRPSTFAQKQWWKLSDPSLESSAPKYNSFLSILPPNWSKVNVILPPPPPRPRLLLEEQQREDYEWINKMKKEPFARILQQSQIAKPITPSTCHNQMGLRPNYCGAALAVQIRSVIPVCAAPPLRPISNPMKEAAASSSSSLGNLKL